MANSPAVEVVGLGKFLRQIKQLDPDVLAELKAANRDIADDVTSTAKQLAPRLTGRLGASVRPGATNRTGIVRAGSKRVPWAGPQHFGWAARNIEPQPFLYDALDDRRDEVVTRYREAVNDAVRKVT